MNAHVISLKKQQKTGGDPLQCVNAATLRQLQIFAEAHSIKGIRKLGLSQISLLFNLSLFKAYAWNENDSIIFSPK